MELLKLGNETRLKTPIGPVPILQQPLKSMQAPYLLNDVQSGQEFDKSRRWQKLAVSMPFQLRTQQKRHANGKLPMVGEH